MCERVDKGRMEELREEVGERGFQEEAGEVSFNWAGKNRRGTVREENGCAQCGGRRRDGRRDLVGVGILVGVENKSKGWGSGDDWCR